MPRYLLLATYSPAGSKGVIEGGMVARRDAVTALAAARGGTLEHFEMTVGGQFDFMQIISVPSAAAASTVLREVGASGGFGTVSVTELVSLEDFDAARPAHDGAYRAPNG